jgi:hypothetical protein
MWRPAQMSGAPGLGCGCDGSGFAGAPPRRYPAIENALRAYVAGKVATGQYFYITPQLNTAAVRQSTFGGMGATMIDTGDGSSSDGSDPITAAATDIGSAFSNLWSGMSSAAGNPGITIDSSGLTGNWTGDLQQIAQSTGNSTVLSLPADARPQVQAAAQTDLFGVPLSPLVIGGAAAAVLGLVLLASAPRGKRRRR